MANSRKGLTGVLDARHQVRKQMTDIHQSKTTPVRAIRN
jgi:hypothetical protein